MTFDEAPSAANAATWGNTLAHEIFHYWNGGRLRESDYVSLQWFKEGFTEYAANFSMVTGKLVGPEEFARTLSEHVAKSRTLTTTLEAGGSRKGPPLYSAGALVAFSWDVRIRQATAGKRTLTDFWRALWHETDRGRKPYAWPEIRAALEATAPWDWEAFYRAHIRGSEPLRIVAMFKDAGLRLEEGADGSARVTIDPQAMSSEKAVWRRIVEVPSERR